MKCPHCGKPPATFAAWFLRPGPKRDCLNCGALLHYRHFYAAIVFHMISGVGLGAGGVIAGIPLGIPALAIVLTAVVYPWFFAKYEVIHIPDRPTLG